MVKGDVEVPSEVTANKRFRAKHTDDCWIFPHISKLCNFYLAEVRRRGTHLRRDTRIPQWFQASKAATASDGHAGHF
jgi:hypothetical protein